MTAFPPLPPRQALRLGARQGGQPPVELQEALGLRMIAVLSSPSPDGNAVQEPVLALGAAAPHEPAAEVGGRAPERSTHLPRPPIQPRSPSPAASSAGPRRGKPGL